MTYFTLRFQVAAVIGALVSASAVPVPVLARQHDGESEARQIMSHDTPSERGRSLSEAIRRVQRSTGGQILGAERVPFDGRNINRVKYLDDRGRVRYMDDTAPERSPPRAPRPSEAPGGSPPRGANR